MLAKIRKRKLCFLQISNSDLGAVIRLMQKRPNVNTAQLEMPFTTFNKMQMQNISSPQTKFQSEAPARKLLQNMTKE